MKTAVRVAALDMAGLAKAEDHGKRLDTSSQRRRVREASPLVIGGLDLRALYDEHVDGCRVNVTTKKPVLHMIVRMPPELLDGPGAGPFVGSSFERQAAMLDLARRWADGSHGGNAVFAARLDRDEAGETICDLFLAPRYAKQTKRRKGDDAEVWVSPTRFGKLLAEKHQDEIQRRHPKAKGVLTGPRHVGIALQSDWREFFERETGLKLVAKVEKGSSAPDRIEKEAHDRIRAAEAQAVAKAASVTAEAEAIRSKAVADALAASAAFAALAVEIENGTLTIGESGKPRVENLPVIRAGGAPAADAARAVAVVLDGARKDRKAAHDAWESADAARIEAEVARDEALSLMSSLRSLLGRLRAFMRRPDLPAPARAEADSIASDPLASLLAEEPAEDAGFRP